MLQESFQGSSLLLRGASWEQWEMKQNWPGGLGCHIEGTVLNTSSKRVSWSDFELCVGSVPWVP